MNLNSKSIFFLTLNSLNKYFYNISNGFGKKIYKFLLVIVDYRAAPRDSTSSVFDRLFDENFFDVRNVNSFLK